MRGRPVFTFAALVLADFLPGASHRELSLDDGKYVSLLACEGVQREVASGCAPVACEEGCTPVAAAWGSWGEWGECGCIGTQERSRVLATAAACHGERPQAERSW